MSELVKHPVEPMPGHEKNRVWQLSLARDAANRAMERLEELSALWPEEAKRIDLYSIHRKWERVKETADWHAGKVRV